MVFVPGGRIGGDRIAPDLGRRRPMTLAPRDDATHRSVGLVGDPAIDVERGRPIKHEIAISDALDPACHTGLQSSEGAGIGCLWARLLAHSRSSPCAAAFTWAPPPAAR